MCRRISACGWSGCISVTSFYQSTHPSGSFHSGLREVWDRWCTPVPRGNLVLRLALRISPLLVVGRMTFPEPIVTASDLRGEQGLACPEGLGRIGGRRETAPFVGADALQG